MTDENAGEDRDAPQAQPAPEVEQQADGGSEVEVQHPPVEVGLQRSVRIGRIIVAGIVLGVVAGAAVSLLFPVPEGANYELGQVTGVAAVFGGVVGLALGALLALLLGIAAKRNRGAAMAVQTDVR